MLLTYARLGRSKDADETVARLLKQAGADRQVLFQTACGLSILAAGPGEAAGECLDRAFEVLTKLVDGGWQDRAALETDPDLDAVRKDKRFAELVRRLEGMKPSWSTPCAGERRRVGDPITTPSGRRRHAARRDRRHTGSGPASYERR